MSAQEPLVSICIPTYNRAVLLKKAVEAALGGTYRNIEIIISDNASTDGTEAAARELVARDPRVRYHRQERNMGPTWNFQFVRRQARGKYFLWYSDDDYVAPDYVQACVSELEADPELVLAAGVGAYHRGDGRITHFGNILHLESPSAFTRVTRYLFQVNDNSVFYGIYRRDAVAMAELPNCLAGDRIWMCEVLLYGKARVLPDAHIFREWGDSMSASYVRIVALLGEPAWHARFRFLAIALSTMRILGHHPAMMSKPFPVRAAYQAVIAASLAFRSARFHGKEVALAVPVLGRILKQHMRLQ